DEPLDVEEVLAARANEIYWNWIRKARRRVEAAIARETRRVAEALAQATSAFEAYRASELALRELAPRKQVVKQFDPGGSNTPGEVPRGQATLLADRRLGWWFWPLSCGLILAEFIANAPIFTELFPSSLEIETRVNAWLANNQTSVIWIGLKK